MATGAAVAAWRPLGDQESPRASRHGTARGTQPGRATAEHNHVIVPRRHKHSLRHDGKAERRDGPGRQRKANYRDIRRAPFTAARGFRASG